MYGCSLCVNECPPTPLSPGPLPRFAQPSPAWHSPAAETTSAAAPRPRGASRPRGCGSSQSDSAGARGAVAARTPPEPAGAAQPPEPGDGGRPGHVLDRCHTVALGWGGAGDPRFTLCPHRRDTPDTHGNPALLTECQAPLKTDSMEPFIQPDP